MTHAYKLCLFGLIAGLALGCSSSERPQTTAIRRGPMTPDRQLQDLKKADMPAAQRQFLETQLKSGEARR
jgi:hypothetical protein